MAKSARFRQLGAAARGFTLVELLVVIVIVSIVSAVTIPTIFAALDEREFNDAASLIQSTLAAARDEAVRSGTPKGIRFLPDPDLTNVSSGIYVANRMVAIEQPASYNSGRTIVGLAPVLQNIPVNTSPQTFATFNYVVATEDKAGASGALTSWYWNIRQGERIRFEDSSRAYTIAGPMRSFTKNGRYVPPDTMINPDHFLNLDIVPTTGNPTRFISMPSAVLGSGTTPSSPNVSFSSYSTQYVYDPVGGSMTVNTPVIYDEVLILMNGQDDDGDGLIDEAFDGIDNDGDGVADPGFNGVDDDGNGLIDEPAEMFYHRTLNPNPTATLASGLPQNYMYIFEFEPETVVGTTRINLDPVTNTSRSYSYSIDRRPVVAEGAKETSLPQGVVLDMTTLGSTNERSRAPFDPDSLTIDILFAPNGQVVEYMAGNNALIKTRQLPFYHLWLADRDDIYAPGTPVSGSMATLPMPPGFVTGATTTLKKDRRLITVFPHTGQIVVNSIERFDATNVDRPYIDAQSATREPK